MAAVVHVTTTASTSNVATYATGSFTPTVNDLLVFMAAVGATVDAGAATASANGITFGTEITHAVRGGIDTQYAYVAEQLVPSSPSAMTCTMDVTGDNGTGAVDFVAAITGMSNVGAAAIRQSGTGNGGAGTTPAVTLGSAVLTGNPVIAFLHNVSNPAGVTPPASFTELADTGYTTPDKGAEYAHRDSGETGTTITWGSTSATAWSAIVIEFDASSGSTPINGSDTSTGADAGTLAAAIAGSDTAAAANNATTATTGTAGDTGTGASSASLSAALSASDTASGVDSASVSAGTPVSASDTGAGADTGSLAASLSSADTATGASATALATALAGTDTASAANAATLAATLAATDTGAGASATSLTTAITASDTSSAADTASVDMGATAKSGADTATATDTASVQVLLTVTEVASAADLATLAAAQSTADLATALDLASITTDAVDPNPITFTYRDTGHAVTVGTQASTTARTLRSRTTLDPLPTRTTVKEI